MADEFNEGDPFDPRDVDYAEVERQEELGTTNDLTASIISTRQQSYQAVFKGVAEPWQVELVMLDLANFCRAYRPTFNADSPKRQDLLEGRREVFLRIMDHTHLSHDALFAKYTSAYPT